jgi:hypothetical protein
MWPSSVSLATRAISWRGTPRKRSIALATNRRSVEILTLATADTDSGMPPSEYAPVTCMFTEMFETSMRTTFSTSGNRKPRPPNTTRKPTERPSGVACLRPEKIRISLGRQM